MGKIETIKISHPATNTTGWLYKTFTSTNSIVMRRLLLVDDQVA